MNIGPDELRILRGQLSKLQGYNSWLILFASSFKKVIIKEGEVYIVETFQSLTLYPCYNYKVPQMPAYWSSSRETITYCHLLYEL